MQFPPRTTPEATPLGVSFHINTSCFAEPLVHELPGDGYLARMRCCAFFKSSTAGGETCYLFWRWDAAIYSRGGCAPLVSAHLSQVLWIFALSPPMIVLRTTAHASKRLSARRRRCSLDLGDVSSEETGLYIITPICLEKTGVFSTLAFLRKRNLSSSLCALGIGGTLRLWPLFSPTCVFFKNIILFAYDYISLAFLAAGCRNNWILFRVPLLRPCVWRCMC